METKEEELASYKFDERDAKRAKRQAKRDVKAGKQSMINSFFKKKKGVLLCGLSDGDDENELGEGSII